MRKILLLLAPLLLLAACDPSTTRSVKTVKAIQSWAANDYVSCRDTTLEIILAAQKEKTEDLDARALHGWCVLSLGDLDQAEKVFQALRSFDQNNFHALLGDAWIKLHRRQLDEAEVALELSDRWAIAPFRTPQQSAEGWLAFYRGDYDRAEERFREAEKNLYYEDYVYYNIDYGVKRNWSTQPWVGLGWVEMYRGRPEASRLAFLKGLERDPNCHGCYGGLARLYMGLGKRTKAFKFATKGLAMVRHDPALLSFVNDILFDAKNPRFSVELYQYVVEKSQGDPLYLANLGWAHYYNGDLQAAEFAFEASLHADPDEQLAIGGIAFLQCIRAGGSYAVCIVPK